jgi:hypothetical protein
MNHRKPILLWIVIVVGLTVSCGKPTAPAVPDSGIIWERTYGGSEIEKGNSVEHTSDGGYIITGWTSSFAVGSFDIYLVRTDSNGDTLWTKAYGGEEMEEGCSVCQTADGGFIVAGYTYSYGNGNSDVYLIKTNSSGDTMWTRTVGGSEIDAAYSVANTQDGSFVAAGYTNSFGAVGSDVYLLKVGQDGGIVWEKRIDGSSNESVRSVQETDDQGFIMVGRKAPLQSTNAMIYLIKTNEDGDTTWTRTFGGTMGEAASGLSVCQTWDGGYIISGYDRLGGCEQSKIYLLKTNVSGDSIWANTYGEMGPETGGYSVKQTPDGGYIVVGIMSYGDPYAMKTDAIGDSIWLKTYGGSENDAARSVCLSSDDCYVIAGSTTSFGSGGPDVYLIKLKPEE